MISAPGKAAEKLASREMVAQGFVREGGYWLGHDLRFRHRVVLSWFERKNLQQGLARLRSEVGHQIKWRRGLAEKRPKENAHSGHEQDAARTS